MLTILTAFSLKDFLIFLAIAPVVAAIGLMLSWINKANNPFWVHKQLKKMQKGDIYVYRWSPDYLISPEHHNPDIKVRARVVDFKCSFFKNNVVYFFETNGVPDSDKPITRTGHEFFGWFYGKDEKLPVIK